MIFKLLSHLLVLVIIPLISAEEFKLDVANPDSISFTIDDVGIKDNALHVTHNKQYTLAFKRNKNTKIPVTFLKTDKDLSEDAIIKETAPGQFSIENYWLETSADRLFNWYHIAQRACTKQLAKEAKKSYLDKNPSTSSGFTITFSDFKPHIRINQNWHASLILQVNVSVKPKQGAKSANPIKPGEKFTFTMSKNLQKTVKIDGFNSLEKPIEVETGKAYTLHHKKQKYTAYLIPADRKQDVEFIGPKGKKIGASRWEKVNLGGLGQTLMMLKMGATSAIAQSSGDTIVHKHAGGMESSSTSRTSSSATFTNTKIECLFLADDGKFKLYVSASDKRGKANPKDFGF